MSSDSSDSEPERKQVKKSKIKTSGTEGGNESSSSSEEVTVSLLSNNFAPPLAKFSQPGTLETSSKTPKETNVEAAFAQFYMQRATAEFADDLERLRTSDDFKDKAVPMLIAALRGGTAMFSTEEKKRIVYAGRDKVV